MKKIMVIAMVLLSLLMLASCGGGGEDTTTAVPSMAEAATDSTAESESAKALAEFRKHMKDENYLCGVAYLGYYPEEIGNIIEDLQYKGIYEKHSFLNEIRRKDFYSVEGSEFYAVIPAEGVKIAINEYAFDEDANGSGVRNLAESSETPAFVRGNISDIMPNIQIVITTDDGSTSYYYPSLSLENGTLSKAQQIYDFTPYDLIGGHFENNMFEEDMPNFIGLWWGEYEVDGEVYTLTAGFKENGEATYGYGYGNSEILEYFEGSWYKEDSDTINIVMYGGPDSFDGSESDNTEKYELNGIFDWGCTDTNEMFLTHISGGVLLYGTEGEKFHFEKIVEVE